MWFFFIFQDGSHVIIPANFKELMDICGDRLEHLLMTQCMLRACPIMLKAITVSQNDPGIIPLDLKLFFRFKGLFPD